MSFGQNILTIKTEGTDGFLPNVAHYLDEIRISCDVENLNQIRSEKGPEPKSKAQNSSLDLQVYPNPVSEGAIQVQLLNQTHYGASLSLLDMSGKSVRTQKFYQSIESIPTDDLVPGIYLMVIRSSEHVLQRKVIIQ